MLDTISLEHSILNGCNHIMAVNGAGAWLLDRNIAPDSFGLFEAGSVDHFGDVALELSLQHEAKLWFSPDAFRRATRTGHVLAGITLGDVAGKVGPPWLYEAHDINHGAPRYSMGSGMYAACVAAANYDYGDIHLIGMEGRDPERMYAQGIEGNSRGMSDEQIIGENREAARTLLWLCLKYPARSFIVHGDCKLPLPWGEPDKPANLHRADVAAKSVFTEGGAP